jgi:23S rRNA (cytosine1962-C5)-methyltransferase
VFLHAAEITFAHPATQAPMRLTAPADFDADPRQALRQALIEPEAADAFRVIHGAGDGWPGWFVDKLGAYVLSQSEQPLTAPQRDELARLAGLYSARGASHKILSRHVRGSTTAQSSPEPAWGEPPAGPFEVSENGLRYELSFSEGYSVGLFLDQRDNRRRLLTAHVAAGFPSLPGRAAGAEVLNVFAYTCGFSVCAARGGARVTSLDLSKKYLEWGRRNFALNGLDPAAHDFIYGDAFDWLRRLAKKGRTFDVVVLDPPTFSQSKAGGVFRVESDFGALVAAAMAVLKPHGVLLTAANAAGWPAEKFLGAIRTAVAGTHRGIVAEYYVPQPPDFPVSRAEPAYLKTAWWRLE